MANEGVGSTAVSSACYTEGVAALSGASLPEGLDFAAVRAIVAADVLTAAPTHTQEATMTYFGDHIG
jgi:hypothetical protein